MDLEDYLEPEVMVVAAVTAAVTGAVASPPVRKALRKGAVYGVAGLMILGDRISGLARGAVKSARGLAAEAGNGAQQAATPAETAAG
jgi:hypothetical protein